jgi:hypothetical protein
MTEDILNENEDLIERIVHSPEIEERRELIKELIESIPIIILKKIELKKIDMEKIIKEKNSDIVDVALQTDNKELLYWDELDKTRVIKSIAMNSIEDRIKAIILDDVHFAISSLTRQRRALQIREEHNSGERTRHFRGREVRAGAD